MFNVPAFSGGPSQLVADFDLGEDNSAWVVDVVGRLWFMTGVTASKPQGDGQWWQVSVSCIAPRAVQLCARYNIGVFGLFK